MAFIFWKFANWPSRQGNTWFIELKQNESNPVFHSPSLNTLLLQKRVNHFQEKVTATRNKYDVPIQLQLEGAAIAKGKKETTLKIISPANAKPGTQYAFSVTGKGEKGITAVIIQTNELLLKQFRLMTPFPNVLRLQLHATIIE